MVSMVKLRKALAAISIVTLCFFLYTALSVYLFSLQNTEEPADAAVVLGAAAWYGKPSPVLKERINHAIDLYNDGKVEYIIFTGGTAKGEIKSEARTSMDYAIEQGVDPDKIIIEEKSLETEENLRFAVEEVKSRNLDIETYTLVSDPLHMKRAVLLAEELGIHVISSPTQTSAYHTFETKFPFFLKEWMFYSGYILTAPFRA